MGMIKKNMMARYMYYVNEVGIYYIHLHCKQTKHKPPFIAVVDIVASDHIIASHGSADVVSYICLSTRHL